MTLSLDTRRTMSAAAAGFLTFSNLFTPQSFLQTISKDLNVTTTQIGLAVTVSLLAVATFAPIAGAISDRYGRKNIVVGAALSLVATTLLVAQSDSLAELLVWRALQGILLPFIFSVTVAYIADECTPQEAVRTSGYYISGTVVGGSSGRLLGGLFAGLGGWRWGFVGVAATTLIAVLFVLWAMPREQKFRPLTGGLRSTFRAYRAHLRNPRLIATFFLGFGMLFCMVASFTFVTFRLAEPPFELSTVKIGLIFVVYFLAVFSSPLGTRMVGAIGRQKAMLVAICAASFGLALTLFDSLPLIMAGLAISTSGFLLVQTLAISFIGVIVPLARSSAVGFYVTCYYIGGSLGSVVPGPVWRYLGWSGVIGLCGVVLVLMTIDTLIFWRRTAS